MSSIQDRLVAARDFLVQSPPGEVNDVFSDLRLLVDDDRALELGIVPSLRQYNLEQYTVVDLAGAAKALVTPASVARSQPAREPSADASPVETHLDWRSHQAFDFDHMKATASNLRPIDPSDEFDADTTSILSSLDPVLRKHVENHYSDGVSAIYPLPDERYPDPVVAEDDAPVDGQESSGTGAGDAEAGGVGQVGDLAKDLPEQQQESANVAAETADAAEEALKEGAPEHEGQSAADETVPMDVASPAETGQQAGTEDTAQVEADAPPENGPAAVATEPDTVPEAKERPPRASRMFGLCFVGNKYNPSNYWTGRWRSLYTLDHETGTLDGTAQINIHYYEQGNVQLSTNLSSHAVLSPSPSPEAVVAAIKSSEQTFSTSLSSTYASMSDETFRSLRRALPKTRSKIDWNKAAGYRLGQELGGPAQ
ncbi:hypothetical protein JCM10212_005269 [Sporobolomyces blumeae]